MTGFEEVQDLKRRVGRLERENATINRELENIREFMDKTGAELLRQGSLQQKILFGDRE